MGEVILFAMVAELAAFAHTYPMDTIRIVQSGDTIPTLSDWSKSLPVNAVQQILVPEEFTLVINEFMASNGTAVADEFEEYDDWIELFNFGDQPVNINGIYITDNTNDPGKYRFFSGTGS